MGLVNPDSVKDVIGKGRNLSAAHKMILWSEVGKRFRKGVLMGAGAGLAIKALYNIASYEKNKALAYGKKGTR